MGEWGKNMKSNDFTDEPIIDEFAIRQNEKERHGKRRENKERDREKDLRSRNKKSLKTENQTRRKDD